MKKYIVLIFAFLTVDCIDFIHCMECPPGKKKRAAEQGHAKTRVKGVAKAKLIMPGLGPDITPEHQAILLAAALGNYNHLRRLIDVYDINDITPNQTPDARTDQSIVDSNSRDPLYFAVVNGHAKVVNFLLPEQPLEITMLYDHLLDAFKTCNDEIADIFINRLFSQFSEADKNLFVSLLRDSEEEFEKALAAGADIVGDEKFFYRPLHVAVLFKSEAGVLSLLAAGCPVDGINQEGSTALSWAVNNQDLYASAQLLRAQASTKAAGLDGGPLIHNASLVRELFELFTAFDASVDHCYENGRTALHKAASNGCAERISWLLDYGAHVDACDKKGKTPLHCFILKRIHSKDFEKIIDLLLGHGAHINACVKSGKHAGKTPLNLTLTLMSERQYDSDQCKNVIYTLLKRGADVSVSDHESLAAILADEPLMLAVLSDNKKFLVGQRINREVKKILLHLAIAQRRLKVIPLLVTRTDDRDFALTFLDELAKQVFIEDVQKRYQAIRAYLLDEKTLARLS